MKIHGKKPNSRQIQAEERRVQILDTALAVFAEKGYANTTIIDIAGAAGISSGLMYHYFPGKEKLLEAAIERNSFLPELREILRDTKDRPYREVLKNITLGFINLLERKNLIVRIFLQEGISNENVRKVWANLANNGISLLEKYISARIAAGEFRDQNAEITARLVFSNVIMFHFTRDIFKNSRVTKAEFIDSMIDNLISGIKA
jgi:TetR/AcrR family transcriptional regulator, cholesterol catabolism regulator